MSRFQTAFQLWTRPSQQRRGAAMIIALFVLMAITGHGFVAMQTASVEIRAAGNARLSKQAEHVSAGALRIAMAEIGQAGDGIWTHMRQSGLQTASDTGTAISQVNRSVTLGTASFAGKFYNAPTGDIAALPPTMTVTMSDPLDGFTAAGYSVDYCFKRFRFDSVGAVGVPRGAIAKLKNDRTRFASKRHRAYGILGPLECEGN